MPVDRPPEVLARLVAAANAHDIDALVDCFSVDYVNETPAHPDRDFRGREQVRENWSRIFAAVPDVTMTVLSCAVDGASLWAELEQRGTRPDGAPLVMRGVNIFRVAANRFDAVRFYMEPVEQDGARIGEAVGAHVGERS
jgi:ketosteroid isomerase-like protein